MSKGHQPLCKRTVLAILAGICWGVIYLVEHRAMPWQPSKPELVTEIELCDKISKPFMLSCYLGYHYFQDVEIKKTRKKPAKCGKGE